MALRIMPYRVQHERLAQQHLNLVVVPVLRRQRLQEHDDALNVGMQEVSERLGFGWENAPGSPSGEASRSISQGRQNTRTSGIERRRQVLQPMPQFQLCVVGESKMETYEVGVPHADGILHADFPHEQAIHPPEGELHELHVLRLQMCCQRRCESRCKHTPPQR